jgi:hypothetical protein
MVPLLTPPPILDSVPKADVYPGFRLSGLGLISFLRPVRFGVITLILAVFL